MLLDGERRDCPRPENERPEMPSSTTGVTVIPSMRESFLDDWSIWARDLGEGVLIFAFEFGFGFGKGVERGTEGERGGGREVDSP